MLISYKQLLAIRDLPATDSVLHAAISQLLSHIQSVEDETSLRYRIVHEVYRMDGTANWNRRVIFGAFFRKADAEHEIATNPDFKYGKVGKIHVIRINRQWYRINVTPYQHINGGLEYAEVSRLDYKQKPVPVNLAAETLVEKPEPDTPPLDQIRSLAREVGYAIGLHGSEVRDYDLIATPWTDTAVGNYDLVMHLAKGLDARITNMERKPHGRYAFILQMKGHYKDIDLSVLPRSVDGQTWGYETTRFGTVSSV